MFMSMFFFDEFVKEYPLFLMYFHIYSLNFIHFSMFCASKKHHCPPPSNFNAALGCGSAFGLSADPNRHSNLGDEKDRSHANNGAAGKPGATAVVGAWADTQQVPLVHTALHHQEEQGGRGCDRGAGRQAAADRNHRKYPGVLVAVLQRISPGQTQEGER